MSLAKRVTGLRPRKRLAVGDAAYLVQERQGGMWDDAVALLIETITTGELPSAIVYRVLPRHMAQVKVVDEVHTTVARADLEEWLDRIALVLLVEPKIADDSGKPKPEKRMGKGRRDGLRVAMEAGYQEITQQRGAAPTARELFDWLAENDETGNIVNRSAENCLAYLTEGKKLRNVNFKAFQNRFTRLRRQKNPQ